MWDRPTVKRSRGGRPSRVSHICRHGTAGHCRGGGYRSEENRTPTISLANACKSLRQIQQRGCQRSLAVLRPQDSSPVTTAKTAPCARTARRKDDLVQAGLLLAADPSPPSRAVKPSGTEKGRRLQLRAQLRFAYRQSTANRTEFLCRSTRPAYLNSAITNHPRVLSIRGLYFAVVCDISAGTVIRPNNRSLT
jgi:hypothetical protein